MKNKEIPDNETKAKFLQLYQYNYLCFEGIGNSLWSVGVDIIKGFYVNGGDCGRIYLSDVPPLVLKSLSNISDDDAYYMALFNRDLGSNEEYEELVNHSKNNIKYDSILKSLKPHHIDFLRLKGYAVPYLNHSVNDLINFGWIILK